MGEAIVSIDLRAQRVMVTGGRGFVGQRVTSKLTERGADAVIVRSADYDLTDPERVRAALADLRPRYVVHCAAVVGGIGANRAHPARFFYDNAVMGIHLIHEALAAGVEKLLVVGTVCSYPKFAPVPFTPDDLWNGYPEETNAPYGLAKKMLLVQAQAYREEYGFNAIYLIPTNLFGPRDSFDLETGHVIPSLIRKCVEARDADAPTVTLWGTGSATREFLYVDDAAEGIVLALERYDGPDPVNLASGEEVSIRELAETIADETGFQGEFVWDASKPDGQPRRRSDATFAETLFGFTSSVSLRDGLRKTIEWFEHERVRSTQ